MTTIGDVVTMLSNTGRREAEDSLRNVGINPDKPVFAGQLDRDNVYEVRGMTVEQITPTGEHTYEGITVENDPEAAEEMKTEDSFEGLVLGI